MVSHLPFCCILLHISPTNSLQSEQVESLFELIFCSVVVRPIRNLKKIGRGFLKVSFRAHFFECWDDFYVRSERSILPRTHAWKLSPRLSDTVSWRIELATYSVTIFVLCIRMNLESLCGAHSFRVPQNLSHTSDAQPVCQTPDALCSSCCP